MKIYKTTVKLAAPLYWWAFSRKHQNVVTRTVRWAWRKL